MITYRYNNMIDYIYNYNNDVCTSILIYHRCMYKGEFRFTSDVVSAQFIECRIGCYIRVTNQGLSADQCRIRCVSLLSMEI